MKIISADKTEQYLPLFLLILLSLIWGSSFILMKRGLDHFSFPQVAAIRIFCAGVVLMPTGLAMIGKKPLVEWKYAFIVGLTGNFIPAFMFALAITQLASSITGVLNALTPMFTLILGVWLFKTPMDKKQSAGLLMGFLGSVSLSLIKGDGEVGEFNLYILFVVVATICYAINANLIKVYCAHMKPVNLTSMAMVSVMPFAAVYLFFMTDFLERFTTSGAWVSFGYVAFLGVIGTSLAVILFNVLIKRTSAVYATSVTYIIPLVAIGFGVLDGERLFLLHYFGISLILLGVYMVNRFKRKAVNS